MLNLIQWLICFFAASILPTSACQEPDWRIVVLPDTQHYAEDYPQHFIDQTAWIANNDIDLVLHVGDVVDEDYDLSQWEAAHKAFSNLDRKVPFVAAAGNHDYSGIRSGRFSFYLPPHRMGLVETFDGRSENGYRYVTLGDTEWLILSVEMFPRSAVIQWADRVLATHPNHPTIIVTHAYLRTDGLRYGQTEPPWPNGVNGMRHVVGKDANDGETIYQHLVAPNSQVRMVFSGHELGVGTAEAMEMRADGSVVWQVLQNYQTQLEGGLGFLRIYEGYGQRVEARTWSPVIDHELRDHAFEMALGPPLSIQD